MDIALGVLVAALLAAVVGLGWFAFRAREDSVRTLAEIAALRRGGEESERLRQENIAAMREAAKAASLEAAHSVSSKLLDDHKRETEAASKASEERVRAVSASLVKQVGDIAQAVAGLQTQVKDRGEAVDTLWRVLQNPGSAGAMAEIGLTNTLKSFGLESPRDFLMQYTAESEETGKRLRPDAVVFLPGDGVLVIDCKASKFLLEIAQAEGTEAEATAYANFSRTMNQHLKALADKDYRAAVIAMRRQAGYGDPPSRVHMMMFLPNDAALEKLNRADAGFRSRAQVADILIGGPDVLHCALSLASNEITLARRVENHEKIIDRTRLLLEGIGIALGKAADVGKNLKRAAESFDDFGRSVNRSLLPRARTVVALGVQPGKPLPGPLPAFSVHTEDNVIEGETEELSFPAAPPRLVK